MVFKSLLNAFSVDDGLWFGSLVIRWYAFAISSMMLSVIAIILEVEKESNIGRACLTDLSRSEMELQRRAASLPWLICGR